MSGQAAVFLRILLHVVFASIGSFFVTKGVMTEVQAEALVDPDFLMAAAGYLGNVLTSLYYLLFSESSRALTAWRDDPER